MGGGELHVLRLHLLFLHQTHGFHHKPVGCLLGPAAQAGGLLKDVRHVLGTGEKPGIILRKPVFLLVPGYFLRAQLRLAGLNPGNPLIAYDHRHQIRIREIPVILGILLGSHGLGALLVVIPAPRLLDYLSAFFQQLNLTPALPLYGSGNGLKGVQVLHLGPGAKLRGPRLSHGQVHVRSHGSLLKLAVRGAQVLDNQPQLLQVGYDFLGAAHIRLRHNLNQRDSAAVVIHQGTVLPLIMNQLARILLHVDFMDSHAFLKAGLRLYVHPAVAADRQVQLGYLVVLRIIRIKIVLSVKFAVLVNPAVGCQPHSQRILHHLLI